MVAELVTKLANSMVDSLEIYSVVQKDKRWVVSTAVSKAMMMVE